MPLHENDRPLDGAIRASLLGEDAKRGACPSPDVFAAYYEHSLDPEETARYDRHFITCKSCRQILAGVRRANDSGALAESRSRWAWLKKPMWLVPATAIAAVLAVFLTVELLPHRKSATEPATQLAQVQPVPAAAASPRRAPASTPAPPSPDAADTEARSELELQSPAPPRKKQTQNDELAPPPVLPRVAAPEARAPKTNSFSNASPVFSASAGRAAGQPQSVYQMAAPAKSAPPPAQAAVIAPSSASETVTVTSGAEAVAPEESAAGRIVIASPDLGVVWTILPGGRVDFSGNTANSAVHDFLPTTNAITAGSSPGGKICWLAGTAGTILRTTDGRTWIVVPPPTNADFTAVQSTGASSATVTSTDGRKFSTANAGQTWKALN